MNPREETSSPQERSDDAQDQWNQCAPIRRTLAGELNGLYRFAMARLNHRVQMAEDAVQQAVLIAMTHASPPSQVQSQRAWLRGIVHNVIRSQLRSSRRGRQAMKRVHSELSSDHVGDQNGRAHASDDSKARMVQALYHAVTDLDEADQDLFYAFYRAGRSHACIAAETGSTSKSVEARLYRLRSRLRKAMHGYGDGNA